MNTAKIVYTGNLRTEAVHLRSEQTLITDAPLDNHGKGETFSPSDLLATALVSCMMTTMGIQANERDLQLGAMEGEVEKIMTSNPRKIAGLNVDLTFTDHQLGEQERKFLEDVAINCPVAKSIHPDIAMHVKFSYR